MTGLKADQKPPLLMSAVVAMATNRVIGDGTGLIWHLPDDLNRVKSLTMGCPLIMGRKTWQSIGRPLPGRGSIVLTRDLNWQAEGAVVVHDFEAAIAVAKSWIAAHNPNCEKIILFGGGEIYRMGLDYCHQIDLTVIDSSSFFIAFDGIGEIFDDSLNPMTYSIISSNNPFEKQFILSWTPNNSDIRDEPYIITTRFYNGTFSMDYTFFVYVNGDNTGINEENSINKLKSFPNPTSGSFTS